MSNSKTKRKSNRLSAQPVAKSTNQETILNFWFNLVDIVDCVPDHVDHLLPAHITGHLQLKHVRVIL